MFDDVLTWLVRTTGLEPRLLTIGLIVVVYFVTMVSLKEQENEDEVEPDTRIDLIMDTLADMLDQIQEVEKRLETLHNHYFFNGVRPPETPSISLYDMEAEPVEVEQELEVIETELSKSILEQQVRARGLT